jgi:hypothetical protein
LSNAQLTPVFSLKIIETKKIFPEDNLKHTQRIAEFSDKQSMTITPKANNNEEWIQAIGDVQRNTY